jgi:diguanylate cyclase
VHPTDQIARLGGDEFAILSVGCTRQESVRLAQRIADSLRPPFEFEEIVVDVQASVGIAMFPDDGADVDTLLQRADVAMYRAKEARTDVALYDERHDRHSPSKLALSADLRSAIQAKQIVAWYQPELDLTTDKVFAVEALVRWPHPQLGLLPPAAFLEMAEHTNAIKPLTQEVLQIALGQLATWVYLGIDVTVAVNISTGVLIDERFTDSVMSALAAAKVSPSRLKLEVTESTLMSDPEVTRSILVELSRVGIEISIDDYGTGYSSLAYLADLPVSEVKIDRSFVSRMEHGSKESIIVNSTINLAHHLGLRAVAEGVEDPGVLSRLKALGCDAAQGFVISRPLKAEDLTRWLLENQNLPRIAPRREAVA